ncbi:DeoR/GlpR family DNA-binding transcription regulator [Lichenihabitans sp. Uapishka_5]|uniref:DeoR/GlpR family DNA-binding transcription regulator n=1 Tax=Lichenihabitans sp. Uapishka_5 TaxID=3037302 RepID=UPI0029E80354|nr:DeoR/GlpR family DNA-binding transcription regulator [Lichenihabitans sp. Uapishka_5]MDX7952749.1 DeoR/GlpR family DNA-binding transcription regulator [Lichenihabitans sp. Uapishka_5]
MSLPTAKLGSRRQSEIVDWLRERGRVSVEDLAAHFGVTPQTIRRDLNDLSDSQMVVRVHGGAMVASGVVNLAYEARKLIAGPHKKLIGEAAARLVSDHSSVFIAIGTTAEEVARALTGHAGLLVITNNLNVAVELYRHAAIEVFLTGGTVRQADGGIVGSHTESLIGQFRVDLAIIGTSAIDVDGTLLDFDIREVQAARAIIEHARRVVLVSDGSKFARSAPVRVAHLSEIDTFVTDRLPSPAVADLCRAHAVEVIEAGGPLDQEDDS